MKYFFNDLRNNFDFFFRKRISFSRKNYHENTEDISKFPVDDYLKQNYEISFFEPATSVNFIENIYFLSVFDKYLSKNNTSETSVLDIGSKNWSYVKSEYLFFKTFTENLILNGIELDAYRLNSSFYTRYEVAKFYTKGLSETNYIPGDLIEHDEKYDYIIWILPFITEYPLVRWGLPLKYFKPEEMLLHAYNLLNKGGELLIINQGEEEYNIQQNLYKKLYLKSENFGETEDKYNLFKNKRFCSKIIKQ